MDASRITLPAGAAAGALGATTLAARAASQVDTDANPGDTIIVRNSGTVEAELGSSADVGGSEGFRLASGTTLPALTLADGEELYAAVRGTTAGALDVLIVNR